MKKIKLLDQVRSEIRIRHYSHRTESSYTSWIKQFILFHNKKHPIEMGSDHISSFLTYNTVVHVARRRVSSQIPMNLCGNESMNVTFHGNQSDCLPGKNREGLPLSCDQVASHVTFHSFILRLPMSNFCHIFFTFPSFFQQF